MHYYSESKQAFYVEGLKDLYEQAGTWPEDVVSITQEEYDNLHTGLSTGKTTVKVDKKGKAKIVSISPDKIKEIDCGSERLWRNDELDRADNMIKIVEDGDGVGTVEDWREYRKSLRKWPEHKNFPDSKLRPKAPDAEVTNG